MSRIGTVQTINGKFATISSSRRGICEGCSEKSSCSFDNALGKSVPETVTAINPIQATPGDRVEFDLEGHKELKNSLIVWVIPLLTLVLGAVLGAQNHFAIDVSVDTGTLIGSAFGLLLGFSGVAGYERFLADREKNLPVLIKIIRSDPCPDR